ncbi:hypothetical protein ACJZ2D_004504 [Fusarium nematophilum]
MTDDRLWSSYEELIRTKCGDQQTAEAKRLRTRLEEVRKVIETKTKGSLRLEFTPGGKSSPKVRADVFLQGEQDKSGTEPHSIPHASLGQYYGEKYTRSSSDHQEMLDPEAEPNYAADIPGTITPEGFGIECWEAQCSSDSRPTDVKKGTTKDLEPVKDKSILRRIDEMRRGIHLYERSPEQAEADIKEFSGDAVQSAPSDEQAPVGQGLSHLLNRTDIFTDFTAKYSISSEWATQKKSDHGKWHLLWQIILAKELSLHLERNPDLELSRSVQAALVIQDQWLRNVEVVMDEMPLTLSKVGKLTATREVKARAEDYREVGDGAVKAEQWKAAREAYTRAIELDLSSAVYRASRSVADLGLGNWSSAAQDALVATRLDPKYVHAWNMLGAAWKLGGNDVRALAAYERAVHVAGAEATDQMRRDLAETKAKIGRLSSPESDQASRYRLLKDLGNQHWETFLHPTRLQSHCHAAQVEALVCFAQHIKWPYLDELRSCSRDAWKKTTAGAIDSCLVQDWLLGLTLPGKWMSLKLMACLVEMSPSVSRIPQAASFDHGLSLQGCSYWRSRSVLGRVLGAWPGVTSLCGWVGPCPPVVLDRDSSKKKPSSHVLVKPKLVNPVKIPEKSAADPDLRPRLNEDAWAYAEEMLDEKAWVVPRPPTQVLRPVAVKAIRLRQVQLQHSATNVEYRASIDFSFVIKKLVPLTKVVTYALHTNPVFVSLPPCHGGTKDGHEMHVRELGQDGITVVPVQHMKDFEGRDKSGRLVVIHATCSGGEVMARAWCAEKGRNAVVRRAGGACYACATRAAAKGGLGFGVLIWAS